PNEKFDISKFSKPCAFESVKYTSPATVLYAAQSWDAPALLQLYSTMEFEERGQKVNIGELINKGRENLKKVNLDLDSIVAAFGDENAVVLDWDGKSLPEAGLFMKLAKPENLVPVYTLALAGIGDKPREFGKVTLTVDTLAGNKVAYISYPEAPVPVPPTVVTLGGPVFGVFSNKEAAERYLSKPAAPTSVVDQAQFKEVLPGGLTGKGYIGITYLNTPTILNQASPHLRKAYGDYSPMMTDSVPEFASLTFPDKLVVPDLITAWVLTQKFEGDVAVSVSNSGIGNQLIPIYTTAIGAGVAAQNFMKSMAPPSEPPADKDVKGADAILEELDMLRTAVESYEEKAKPKKGYVLKWSDLEPHVIPGSRLATSGGKDALGNPFVLGKVGGPQADVSKATKAAFPDKNAAFWANEDDEDEKVPSMEADQKKATDTDKTKGKGKSGMKLEE
ncbi:MAG TPA: hypothetical protein VK970_05130, partial [Candidatus Methylacidiphilales bacterium]|nr:hypothetical protein [Candidatus Methylacidiphilales bacterium]